MKKNNWEKEFDKKFEEYYFPASQDGSRWGIDGVYDIDIKSFISSLLTNVREEIKLEYEKKYKDRTKN